MKGGRPGRWARLHRATALLLGSDVRLAARRGEVTDVLAALPAEVVADYWQREGVLVLAVERAASLGVEHAQWTTEADELRAFSARRAAMVDLVALRVSRALEAAGIAPLLLKGPQLAERLHGAAEWRAPSADIDILVPTAQLFSASDVLVELGWQPPSDPLLGNGLPAYHLELRGSGAAPNVELHWRAQWYDDAAHAEGLLARAQRYRGLAVTEPVDLLGVLMLCWVRDGFRTLRLGADIAAWWRTFGEEHGTAATRLWAPGPLQRPLTIGAQAAATVLGTPAPTSPLQDRATRLALRVALTDRPRARRPGGPTQRALVDVLVCPTDRRRERFLQTWALDPAVSHAAHPWAPVAAVLLVRTASATRTSVEAVPIVARAARGGAAAAWVDGGR